MNEKKNMGTEISERRTFWLEEICAQQDPHEGEDEKE